MKIEVRMILEKSDTESLDQVIKLLGGLSSTKIICGYPATKINGYNPEAMRSEASPDMDKFLEEGAQLGTPFEEIPTNPGRPTPPDVKLGIEPGDSFKEIPVTPPELDSDGLPWDGRIHASSKAILAKSKQWKKIRKVDPSLVATVEAELRARLAVQPVMANKELPKPLPVADSQELPPPVQTQPVPTEGLDFPGLMRLVVSKGITPEQSNELAKMVGLDSLQMAATNPGLIPHIVALIP